MQTVREIRRLLEQAGLSPRRQLGQNFLIDPNLMGKLLDFAGLTGREMVLEVGPGTGSLTEELLRRAARVVAVEIDHGFVEFLRRRFEGQINFVLLETDILQDKHTLNPQVLHALDSPAHLVSNLPYHVASPLVWGCMVQSWHARRQEGPGRFRLFERLTFTVQQELAQRMSASSGNKQYGPISVLVSLLGRITLGPKVPPAAFWPSPEVLSRMVRIDFEATSADRLNQVGALTAVLALAFKHRRKQLGWVLKESNAAFSPQALGRAMEKAGISPADRAESLEPQSFLTLANTLAAEDRNPPLHTWRMLA